MKIRIDHVYIFVAFLLLCLIAIMGNIFLTNKHFAQQAAEDTAQLTPKPTPTLSVPNPLIYLTSKQINVFFQSKPPQDTLTKYKAQVAQLPAIKMPIRIKTCDIIPAMDVVTSGTTLLFQNTDTTPHTITYQNHQTTIPASGSAKITNATRHGSLDTYDCDGTKYVGVIYSR